MTGVSLSGQVRAVDDLPALEEARAEIVGRLPSDEAELLEWALDLSRDGLLAVLAVLVASAVDLAHEDTSQCDLRKQALGDLLAQRLDIDMTQFWKADLSFWAHLPKATLMAVLAESAGIAERGVRTRDDLLKAHGKLRKDELAAKVAAAFDGGGYLQALHGGERRREAAGA